MLLQGKDLTQWQLSPYLFIYCLINNTRRALLWVKSVDGWGCLFSSTILYSPPPSPPELLTFQCSPSRTLEFIFKSCPQGKESDSFLLLVFLLLQLTFSLCQLQLGNFYDYLTTESKKSFGNNLSWVSSLKPCGSSANASQPPTKEEAFEEGDEQMSS